MDGDYKYGKAMNQMCKILSLLCIVLATYSMPAAGQAKLDPDEAVFLESVEGVRRGPLELVPFAGGTIHLAFNESQDGMVYELNVKAPNVVEARLEQPGTGLTYVEVVAEGSRGERIPSREVGASVGVDSEFVEGPFAVKVPGGAPMNVNLVLVTPDGQEVLWVLTTKTGLDGKEIDLIFSHRVGSAAPCHTYTLNCSGGCSKSKECCTIKVCLDCVNCEITCGTLCRTIP